MRFAVLGAGAIGAYVGAALARGGADVTLIARGEHLRAMQADGVTVTSPRGDFDAHPPATDDLDVARRRRRRLRRPQGLQPARARAAHRRRAAARSCRDRGAERHSVVVLPVATRARSRARCSKSSTRAASIAAAIPPEAVIGCVVYCSTEIVEPGVIRHVEGTRFAIGEPDGELSERCRAISEAFVAGGLQMPGRASGSATRSG